MTRALKPGGVLLLVDHSAKSDLLRKPGDARDQLTYKGPMAGKTDRFVVVFRKVVP